MKRIICITLALLLALAMLTVLAYAAELPKVSLSVDRTRIRAGETVTVTVALDTPMENVMLAEFYIHYDTALFERGKAVLGTALEGTAVSARNVAPDGSELKGDGTDGAVQKFSVNALGEAGASGVPGTIASIRFTAREDLPADATAAFNLEYLMMEDDAFLGLDVQAEGEVSVLCTAAAEAPEVIAEGWSGYTRWRLTDDGVMTFWGEGNMKNYGFGGVRPWQDHAGRITKVVIEEGVTAVGSGAFMDMTSLESVTLPQKGLNRIGEGAFYGCTALKKIAIPAGVYTVWAYTFKNCTALEVLDLPQTLIKIDQGGFENCTALKSVTLPANLNIISYWSFKGCTGLEEADMGQTCATEIRAGAFKNCSALTAICLPGGIRTLGDSCFYGIGAESFTVPGTVTAVEGWCFARSRLKQIIFQGDAPVIGEGAFNKIALTAYYPAGNGTWTEDVMQHYGGTVTWTAN